MASKLRFPFPPFFGISFYKNIKIETPEGYRLEQVDPNDFEWAHYWYSREVGVVLACKIYFPLRILAASDQKDTSAVMEVPEECWLIHNYRKIWHELIPSMRELEIKDNRRRS